MGASEGPSRRTRGPVWAHLHACRYASHSSLPTHTWSQYHKTRISKSELRLALNVGAYVSGWVQSVLHGNQNHDSIHFTHTPCLTGFGTEGLLPPLIRNCSRFTYRPSVSPRVPSCFRPFLPFFHFSPLSPLFRFFSHFFIVFSFFHPFTLVLQFQLFSLFPFTFQSRQQRSL